MAKITLTLPITSSGGSSGNTNLSYISSPIQGTVTSDTGSDATIPLADNTNAGLLDPSKYTVLENIRGINTGDQDLQQVTTVGSTTTDKISVIIPTGNVNALSLQNNGTAATLTAENGLGVAIFGKSNVGYGVYGETVSSVGVSGYASGSGSGVFGNSITGAAINGSSGSGIAIYGTSTTGVGLQISTPLTNNSNLANFYHNNVSVANISKFGDITSNSFKIPTGTSSQFLKADGSLDSNTYLTSLTGAELLVNKQNSLAVDGTGTKYPTVDAVNAAIPASYAVVVYVNATSPNTSTIFDDVNPPVTNDDTLKIDTDNLYIGTDASTWVYDGTTYITKTIPASSNFKIVGTGVDAGSNKTASIFREGSIGSDAFVSSNAGMFINRNGSNTAQNGGFMAFSNAAASNINMFQLNASNGLDLWNFASGTWGKRFTFTAGGNLGIGEGAPLDQLVVSKTVGANTGQVRFGGANGRTLSAYNNGALSNFDFMANISYFASNLGIASQKYLSLYNYVGTLPNYYQMILDASENVSFRINGTNAYVISPARNLLLGTTTDDGANKLQVNGSTKTTALTLTATPTTSAGTYDFVTRNTTTGVVEKVLSNTIATTASPTFTGTPTAPTATAGTNTTQIATTAFVQAATTGTFVDLSANQTINGLKSFSNKIAVQSVEIGKGTGSGYLSTSIGEYSLASGTTQEHNTSIGYRALVHSTTTQRAVAVGMYAGEGNTEGNDGVYIGYKAGSEAGVTTLSRAFNTYNSVFLGSGTRPLVDGQTNQIVIGYDAYGAGSNTATLGNTSITSTVLRGTVNAPTVVSSSLSGTGTRNVKATSTGQLTTTDFIDAKSARFELSADLSLPISTAGSVSVVDFDSSIFNNDTVLFSNNGSGVITCNRAGIYLVTTSVVLESPLATALTRTDIGIRKNGTAIIAATTNDATLALGNNVRSMTTSTIINLAANDTIEAVVNLFGATATGLAVRLPSLFGTTVTQVSNISIQKLEL